MDLQDKEPILCHARFIAMSELPLAAQLTHPVCPKCRTWHGVITHVAEPRITKRRAFGFLSPIRTSCCGMGLTFIWIVKAPVL